MSEQNLKYIANLKAQDVPWSRLTTAYGRASEFPEIFKKLVLAIEACDSARGLGGEQNLKSEPDAGQNLKNHPGCGQNSTDAARCGAAQNFVNLAQKSESKFKKADNEAAKFKAGGAEFKSTDSEAIKFKASAADKSSDAGEREKFDAEILQDALSKIFKEIEHQSTFWHATPFALLFLARIFMQARAAANKTANKNNQNAAADKKRNIAADRNGENENSKDENGENEAAGFIEARLGGFFAFMLEICDDADKISHAAPLASFSDMLAEKYLWPQSDENDEELWEEHFYDDELFYSLYFYSRAVLDAKGVDFAQFKPGPGGV